MVRLTGALETGRAAVEAVARLVTVVVAAAAASPIAVAGLGVGHGPAVVQCSAVRRPVGSPSASYIRCADAAVVRTATAEARKEAFVANRERSFIFFACKFILFENRVCK